MRKDTHAAAEAAAAAPAPRKGRHTFVVNAGRDLDEFEVEADDFTVEREGVYFSRGLTPEDDQGHVAAFVSHPCIVRLDDDGDVAAAREPGK